MCTVTYIPTQSGFRLTSSRDERIARPTLYPKKYILNGNELFYPKDEQAGGTWIAMNPVGRAVCLLNGAFKAHEKQEKYSRSRGLVLIESFSFSSIGEFMQEIELKNIEPFTLLLLDFPNGSLKEFWEFRWDGNKKYLKPITKNQPVIWSSATLYSEQIQKQREGVFNSWIEINKEKEDRSIINFHNRRHGLSGKDDIIMQREDGLMTLSISQIHVEDDQIDFNYWDIVGNKQINTKINNNVSFYA